jgi:glutamine amidotransferase
MNEIAILDYALGNLFNVRRAFESIGANAYITDHREDIEKAGGIVLPGVGAFAEGMKQLRKKGLDEVIRHQSQQGKPILGICLGMQLLMSESEENGQWEGLNLIDGKVVYLEQAGGEERFKLPQIGWNSLFPSATEVERGNGYWKSTILEGLKANSYMYFVHSLCVRVDEPTDCISETGYGHNRFCSVVQRGNVMGCQFHPERSAEDGIRILRNFASLV